MLHFVILESFPDNSSSPAVPHIELMSFPFYNRLSTKTNRTKDIREAGHKHASASFATEPFNASQGVPGHTQISSSSKMRLFPFLGKRRKSLATLRPSANDVVVSGDSRVGRGHHKSVSQLVNECVSERSPGWHAVKDANLISRTSERLAKSTLGAAPSRSTGNLQLSAFEPSTLNLSVDSAFIMPTKNCRLDGRHSMIPTGDLKSSTPDKLLVAQNKHSSDKPVKPSFLSRISSRPSLSARYSSADLKSGTKSRGFFKGPEKHPASLVTPQRKGIIHPLCLSNGQSPGDDKDFFTSPRAAPTPPSLSFASPDNSLLESPLGPSQSAITLPSQKHSPQSRRMDSSQSPGKNTIRRVNAAQGMMNHNSSSTGITNSASLSPEMAIRSPRRHSAVSTHSQTVSPSSTKSPINTSTETASPSARPRGSHVRIGTEKVTISVANMLEAELGVEVGDSEDSSYYDDSYEETRRFGSEVSRLGQKHTSGRIPVVDSSDLPPLSPSADDFDLSFKFPKTKRISDGAFELNSQSPLTALMTASVDKRDRSPSIATGSFRSAIVSEAKQDKTGASTHQTEEKHIHSARSAYLLSLGSQARDVDRLDRISERSVHVPQESPCDADDQSKKALSTSNVDGSAVVASDLQHALDVQCARFDKLAGHLLQIIQRHQNEKVQLESQITTLQKEAHRNEKEIRALRGLIARSNDRSSRDGWNTRRLVRVASMQSFLSDISAKDDEEVDMSVAVEMLARAGRRNILLTPDASRDLRASIDFSPALTQIKIEKVVDLRRSKTMPDLHKVSISTLSPASVMPSPTPSPPLNDASPDISGLGLGLDFPLPEPLKLPSIASTIMAAAKESNLSIPDLTTAPTAASGLTLATEPSINGIVSADSCPSDTTKPARIGRCAGRSAREKRMAGEWRPDGMQRLYRPADEIHVQQPPPSAPPTCKIPSLPASTSYANNLNKALVASPIERVMRAAASSPDLDAIYQKIVSNSNGILG